VLCEWHVNEAHYLEAWGDIRGHDGTAAIIQPLIAPLHGGRSAIELFSAVLPNPGDDAPGAVRVSPSTQDPYDVVRNTWRAWFNGKNANAGAGAFEIFWQQTVRSGVAAGSAPAPVAASLQGNWAEEPKGGTPAAPQGKYELNIRACPSLYDGRFANNGWLQELPKPLTKISWDNAAFLSPKTADELGLETDYRWTAGEHGRADVNVIELDVGGRKVKAPVWILPGHVDGAISVHLGHGRDPARVGRVAMLYPDAAAELNVDGKLNHGFNAYPLRTSDALWTTGVDVAKTDANYFLACTQGHWAMAEKDTTSGKILDRKPVRRGSLDDYKKNPAFAKIPPTAVGETDLINDNVPVPKPRGQKNKPERAGGRARTSGTTTG
jgi:molybdopterin-containing oxidoreductase family iron-sulfur binding subunit